MVDKIKYFGKLLGGNVLIFLILLLIIEICIHFFFINTTNENLLNFASLNQLEKRGLNPIYTPHRYLGYTLSPNYRKDKNRHNSIGFRGDELSIPKKEGTYRIFCLGGSTTYTTHVKDYKKSYPYLLEQNLIEAGIDVEVINAGVGSWTSFESLINLQLRILDLEPDMIIIYHSINDVKNRMVFPFEEYKSDNSGRRAPLISYKKSWSEWMIERSNILRIICIKFKISRSKRSILTVDPMMESYVGDDFASQIDDEIYPTDIFSEYDLEEILAKNRPIYYKRNIELMIALAKSYEIDIVLSTFAFSNVRNKKKLSNRRIEIQNALKDQNLVIKQIASEQELVCFDFDKRFSNRKKFFSDVVHVNEKGSAVKAKMFSDFLMKHFFATNVVPLK